MLGIIGTTHPHISDFTAVLKERGVRDGIVWDEDAAFSAQTAGALNWKVARHYRDILENPAVTAVIIAGDTARHSTLTREAASAGKHVFIEKPLAHTAAEAFELAAQIENAGIVFHTGYFLKALPAIEYLADLRKNRHFGTLESINISFSHDGLKQGWLNGSWLTDQNKAGGGALIDLGLHAVYLLEMLGGPIKGVQAETGTAPDYPTNVKDHFANALVTFENMAAKGYFYAGWQEDPSLPARKNPQGARLSVHLQGDKEQAVFDDRQAYYTARGKQKALPTDQPDAGDSLRQFLAALETGDESLLIKPADAAADIRIIEKLYHSAVQNRTLDIALPGMN